jgi:hypothetical protein
VRCNALRGGARFGEARRREVRSGGALLGTAKRRAAWQGNARFEDVEVIEAAESRRGCAWAGEAMRCVAVQGAARHGAAGQSLDRHSYVLLGAARHGAAKQGNARFEGVEALEATDLGCAGHGQARQCPAGRGIAVQGKTTQSKGPSGHNHQLEGTRHMQLQRIAITIEGTTPLICNRFTAAAQMKATSGAGTVMTGDKGSPRDQAEPKLYLNNDGVPGIPQPNLFRCVIDAGKYFKHGKSKITTQKSSVIPACVDIEGVMIDIESKDGWDVDTRPVRIPATGGRILCHRPVFNDWRLTFVATVDTDMLGLKLFRDIVDAAGLRIGLGDFRPDCKGPFGKFKVVSWEVEQLAEAAE